MAGFKRFEDIKAWQAARQLTFQVNTPCAAGPASRNFVFRDQICGAAISTMNNIAEGLGRNSAKDFAHFLDMAKGSAMEVQNLLYVPLDMNYIAQDGFDELYKLSGETAAMVGSLAMYLRGQRRSVNHSEALAVTQDS